MASLKRLFNKDDSLSVDRMSKVSARPASSMSFFENSINSAVYNPLPPQSIRLVKLDTPSWKDSLQDACFRRTKKVELVVFPLDELPPFQTLSCEWEGCRRRRALRCNNRKMGITEPMDDAMAALGSLMREGRMSDCRWIWVEEICVNQSDLAEKISQASLVSDIYAKARGTIVWMNPKDELGPYQFAEDPYERWVKTTFENEEETIEDNNQLVVANVLVDDTTMEGLFQLLSQPWFKSAAALQAVAFPGQPPKIIYGSVILSWPRLMSVVEASIKVSRQKNLTANSPLLPAWPDTMQSMALWITRIHARDHGVMNCLDALAFLTRNNHGVKGFTQEDMMQLVYPFDPQMPLEGIYDLFGLRSKSQSKAEEVDLTTRDSGYHE